MPLARCGNMYIDLRRARSHRTDISAKLHLTPDYTLRLFSVSTCLSRAWLDLIWYRKAGQEMSLVFRLALLSILRFLYRTSTPTSSVSRIPPARGLLFASEPRYLTESITTDCVCFDATARSSFFDLRDQVIHAGRYVGSVIPDFTAHVTL